MALAAEVITPKDYSKVGYGPKKFKRAILNGEATAYGYYEYKGKTTSTGIKITKDLINKLIAVDKNIIKMGESLEVYSRKTKKLIFKGVANDYCPSKPRNPGNAVLIDCFLNTLEECNAFGRQNVVIFVV